MPAQGQKTTRSWILLLRPLISPYLSTDVLWFESDDSVTGSCFLNAVCASDAIFRCYGTSRRWGLGWWWDSVVGYNRGSHIHPLPPANCEMNSSAPGLTPPHMMSCPNPWKQTNVDWNPQRAGAKWIIPSLSCICPVFWSQTQESQLL